MQNALEESQAHIATLAQQMETMKNQFAQERAAAENMMQTMREQMSRMEHRATGDDSHTFLNLKTMQVKTYAGEENDNIKPWTKTVTSYLNAKHKGMREALKWAKNCKAPIEDLSTMGWDPATHLDGPLHEYLTTITTDKALTIVESAPGRGFEAWRRLQDRYNPVGGRYELSRLMRLIQVKQCKTMSEIPFAIDRLKKDIEGFETRSRTVFPEVFKVPLLQALLPEKVTG